MKNFHKQLDAFTLAEGGRRPRSNSGIRQVVFTPAEECRRPHSNSGIRQVAFTLAEVLITLAVIGIVTALTIPTLVQNYKERAIVTSLKKVYSTLSQAYNMAVAENGSPQYWVEEATYVEDPDNPSKKKVSPAAAIHLSNIMSKYLSIAKNCGSDDGCWYDGDVHKIDGTVLRKAERNDLAKVLLSDGTMLAFGGQVGTATKDGRLAWFLVDVNGASAPNKYGYDIYEFALSGKGIYPYGLPDDKDYQFDKDCLSKTEEGHGCTAWVIQNGNMDYWKCNDLSWGGKHKCSD